MGISMAILIASDAELAGYQRHPRSLEGLLNRVISNLGPEMSNLFDTWDGLHHLLTAETGDTLPMAALTRGQVHYEEGVSEPTHSIDSALTREWLEQLEPLSTETRRARFEALLEGTAKPRGVAGRMCALYRSNKARSVDAWFEELEQSFVCLRQTVDTAAQAGKGLIFCRWEDW